MTSKLITISILFTTLFGTNCSHSVKLITQENAFKKLNCFSVTLPSNGWNMVKKGNDNIKLYKQNSNDTYEMGYDLMTPTANELTRLNITATKEYINHLIDRELNKQNSTAEETILNRERFTTYSNSNFYYGIKTISENEHNIIISYSHFVVPGKADAVKVIHCYYRELKEKIINENSITDEYLKSIMTIKINNDCFGN